jgi:hypothetical protein
MRRSDTVWDAVPVARNAEWALSHAWWQLTRSSEGKQECLQAWALLRRKYCVAQVCADVSATCCRDSEELIRAAKDVA